MKEDLHKFSSKPFTADEWRQIRSDLELLDRIRPLVTVYENGQVVGRFLMIVGAWVLGTTTAMLGIFGGLRFLDWWPFNGGGP